MTGARLKSNFCPTDMTRGGTLIRAAPSFIKNMLFPAAPLSFDRCRDRPDDESPGRRREDVYDIACLRHIPAVAWLA